jgi:2,3,4,5-tetrahydropyridine-2,6-dicarboxylate N-succinyltransferase
MTRVQAVSGPINPLLESKREYPFVTLDRKRAALVPPGVEVINFGIGDPREVTPEFIRARLRESVPEMSSYPAAAGSPELRAACARWAQRRFGVPLDPERHVLPANGTKEAVFLMALAVVGRDGDDERRTVVIPTPAYPVYESGARFAGADVHTVALRSEDGFHFDPARVPDEVWQRTALLWLNSPHNPTGATLGRDALARIAELARRHGFWVAADEAYAEIWFDSPPVSMLQCGLENVIALHTLSKRSAMTGFRSGFMAGDERLIDARVRAAGRDRGVERRRPRRRAARALRRQTRAGARLLRQTRLASRSERGELLSVVEGPGRRRRGVGRAIAQARPGRDAGLVPRRRRRGLRAPRAGARAAAVPRSAGAARDAGGRMSAPVHSYPLERWREAIAAGYAGSLALDDAALRGAVEGTIAALDAGDVRVAEKRDGEWITHGWIQQAIALYFRVRTSEPIIAGPFEFHDKIPTKHGLAAAGVRVVPPGMARYGSFLEPGVILMPGYVNIGARVGEGTMVDTWATVGSCAQIGRRVHLSGGVGIGGVLEPPQSRPVIVEDDCFVGSRAIVVEGVLVEEGAVLGAGVVLTASTPIVDVTGKTPVETRGRVPARAVVIPGTRPKRFAAGEYGTPCALVIGTRSASTDRKTSLNDALREYGVPV